MARHRRRRRRYGGSKHGYNPHRRRYSGLVYEGSQLTFFGVALGAAVGLLALQWAQATLPVFPLLPPPPPGA
jgi:hypothetical protein